MKIVNRKPSVLLTSEEIKAIRTVAEIMEFIRYELDLDEYDIHTDDDLVVEIFGNSSFDIVDEDNEVVDLDTYDGKYN